MQTGIVTTWENYKNLYRGFVVWENVEITFQQRLICDLGTLFCLSGDVSLVQYAVNKQLVSATSCSFDCVGNNALHLTALSGSAEAMREAKKIPGLYLAAVNVYNQNALQLAALSGSLPAIEEAKKITGIDLNARGTIWRGGNALHIALCRRLLKAIRVLAKIPGIDVNSVNDKGDHVLHLAAETGSPEVIREVLKIPGLNVNVKNGQGENPLHVAYWNQLDPRPASGSTHYKNSTLY